MSIGTARQRDFIILRNVRLFRHMQLKKYSKRKSVMKSKRLKKVLLAVILIVEVFCFVVSFWPFVCASIVDQREYHVDDEYSRSEKEKEETEIYT